MIVAEVLAAKAVETRLQFLTPLHYLVAEVLAAKAVETFFNAAEIKPAPSVAEVLAAKAVETSDEKSHSICLIKSQRY